MHLVKGDPQKSSGKVKEQENKKFPPILLPTILAIIFNYQEVITLLSEDNHSS